MEAQVPDVYTDSVSVQVTPFGVLSVFGLSLPTKGEAGSRVEHAPVVNLRMSLEHAKVFAILLARELHIYEEQAKALIPLHPGVVKTLNLTEESWK